MKKRSADESRAVAPPTATSGIEGLDSLLRGGFMRDEMHLAQGMAGTGKTTLALHFLLAGVEAGETALFVTLSQSKKSLENIARSHGWSLEGVNVHELAPGSSAERIAARQSVLHTADVELEELTGELRDLIERIRPRRLAFDSLGALRLLAGSVQNYHREILTLRQMLSERGCTALFLVDRTTRGEADDTPADELHALAGSVLHLEQTAPDYGEVRRRLRIVKARGMAHEGGYHDFRLRTGGIEVYPRLRGDQMPEYADFRPVPSGLKALDELLGRGLEQGTTCLLVGPPGSGKSTLASAYAHAAARRGERTAIFLFEERPETFKTRSAGLGFDLRAFIDGGLVSIRQLNTAEVSPGEFAQRVGQAVERGGARLVVIDSLTGYFNAMPDDRMLVAQMHELLNFLSRRGVLTLLTISQEGFMSVGARPPVDISYLFDSVLALQRFEADGCIHRCLTAIKKRQGEHKTTIRELLINPQGIEVGQPLDHFANVFIGGTERGRQGRHRVRGRKAEEAGGDDKD